MSSKAPFRSEHRPRRPRPSGTELRASPQRLVDRIEHLNLKSLARRGEAEPLILNGNRGQTRVQRRAAVPVGLAALDRTLPQKRSLRREGIVGWVESRRAGTRPT